MPTTITLKIKDEQGNIRKETHEIEDINLIQYVEMMKVVNEIIKELQQDDSLKGFVSDIFGDQYKTSESDAEELVKEMDASFVLKAVNSFQTLAIKMPEKAFKLISVLSGIDLEVLKKQKFIDVMDIYDAIIEENDIEKLVNRIKKSLALTVTRMKFKELVTKAAQKMKQA
ncbi:hypothetical protein [Niallia sp. 03190]|uniref:hypothetical protein n=1 Tax=Niallia sp. 03190 TaxID=3458061 RepID=UPI004043C547